MAGERALVWGPVDLVPISALTLKIELCSSLVSLIVTWAYCVSFLRLEK